jgi:hypothetical protein
MDFQHIVEEINVAGRDLVEKVRELIHEGNVKRIIVKDEHGNTFLEIPVTVAAVGVLLAIVVVRNEPKPPEKGGPTAPAA